MIINEVTGNSYKSTTIRARDAALTYYSIHPDELPKFSGSQDYDLLQNYINTNHRDILGYAGWSCASYAGVLSAILSLNKVTHEIISGEASDMPGTVPKLINHVWIKVGNQVLDNGFTKNKPFEYKDYEKLWQA